MAELEQIQSLLQRCVEAGFDANTCKSAIVAVRAAVHCAVVKITEKDDDGIFFDTLNRLMFPAGALAYRIVDKTVVVLVPKIYRDRIAIHFSVTGRNDYYLREFHLYELFSSAEAVPNRVIDECDISTLRLDVIYELVNVQFCNRMQN